MAPLTTITPFFPSHTLIPSLTSFIAQLPPLTSPSALKAWYTSASTDPLHPALLFCAGLSFVVWVLGEITGNVSQVDRLWAALPLVYSIHFALWPKISGAANGVLSDRMMLILGLQVLWSLRLHTNTYRRGFFNPKSEDYRWLIVRDTIPTWLFKLFSLIFIAIIQNILLLIVELPQYLLLTLHLSKAPASPSAAASIIPSTPRSPPNGFLNPALNVADYALAAVFVVILCLEMLGDNQQQRYQALKARAVDKGTKGQKLSEKEQAAVSRGFVTGGLWGWSRHPNFACEQSTWWILYLFTLLPFVYASYTSHSHSHSHSSFASHLPSSKVLSHYLTHLPSIERLPTSLSDLSALTHALPSRSTLIGAAKEAYATIKADEGLWWNYSIWGPVSMSALFYASTDLTEKISAGKYPLYKQYQKRVGMFWPPLTIVKGLWLGLTGRRGKVDRQVFAVGEGGGKMKKL